MKSIITILSILILLAACSSISSLTLTVEEIPTVMTPIDSKRIGIIDRTTASSDNTSIFDQLERILSAESFDIDEEAVDNLLEGFGSQVTNRTKFNTAEIIEFENKNSSNISDFPSELSWKQVESLCSINNVDFIVELSFFDTDTEISYTNREKEVDVPLIGKSKMLEHTAKATTNYWCGWRIYEPKMRAILDKFIYESSFSVNATGINPMNALQELITQKNKILNHCRIIGESYAFRLIPLKLRAKRQYFVKGHKKLELAERYAQTGDWQQAGEIWEALVEDDDPKVIGRALYNLAIINEINGNLEKSKELAREAYARYEIDEALNYIKILEKRINDKKILENEM